MRTRTEEAASEAAADRPREADVSTLGGRLRKQRLQLGWTQTQLADRVGTSQAVIQKIENGKSLRPRILEEIAAALGVSPAWLMFGSVDADSLDPEALAIARAWSGLSEPHRTAMREAIMRLGGGESRHLQ